MTTSPTFTITTRRVGKFLEAKIAVCDINLLDRSEVTALANELLSASLELQEQADAMPDDEANAEVSQP